VFDKFKKLLGGGESPDAPPGRPGAGAQRRPAKARPGSAASGRYEALSSSRGPGGGGAQAAGGFTGGPGRAGGRTGGPPDRVERSDSGRSPASRGPMSRGFSAGVGGAPGAGFGPAARLGVPRGGTGPLGGAPSTADMPGAASAAFGSGGLQRPDLAQEIPCPNCGEPMLPGWGTTCGKCRPNLVAAKTMFLSDEQVALPAHAAGAMTLGWLVVIRSPDTEKKGDLVDLDRERVVLSRAGAAPTGSVRVAQFDDSYMSSAHAVIGRPATVDRSDAFTIRDRDNPAPSVNGTFVNSQRLGPGEVVRLADGDVIKVGATELLFKSLWLPPVGARA